MKTQKAVLLIVIMTIGCTPTDRPQETKLPIQGLRTVVYVIPDLDAAKQWYEEAFAIKPYFDQPFYVGFDINGYELGLDPDTSIIKPGPGGSVVYWKVNNITSVYDHMLSLGATPLSPIENVGVLAASVVDPFGNVIGLLEEPEQ